MPVSGGFVRMGSKWVDEAFGFMLGWNFFLYGMFHFDQLLSIMANFFDRGRTHSMGNQCFELGSHVLAR